MPAPRGQNFLYQPGWQRRVADAFAATPADAVLEIGGGTGDVSALLAAAAGHLTIVEVDARLAEGLRRRFAALPEKVTVLEADILEVDLAEVAARVPRGLRVFGNLPYYISSPILFRLFHAAQWIRDATLMVQREVAERMLAAPGAEFGLLSAATRLYTQPRRLFDLPPGAFRPAPKVHSTLLRLDFASRAAELGLDPAAFELFLKLAFAQKRKTLANNLAAGFPEADVAAALEAAGVAPRARAEALSLQALAALHRSLAGPIR